MPKFTDCFYMIDLLLVLVKNVVYNYLDELSRWFYVVFFSGQRAIRPYWRNYYEQVEALVSLFNYDHFQIIEFCDL